MDDQPLLADVAIDRSGRDAYSYLVPDAMVSALRVGDCVCVPFGRRSERAFVIAIERRPPPEGVTLKSIAERQVEPHLPAHLLRLIAWGAHYYRCGMGSFLGGVIPAPVREGVAIKKQITVTACADFAGDLTKRQHAVWQQLPAEPIALADACRLASTTADLLRRLAAAGAIVWSEASEVREVTLDARPERHLLTDEQQAAVDAVAPRIAASEHRVSLLYGVTGSGKTLVYCELIERAVSLGKQALVLLPEIALTPQLAARFRSRFPRLVVWHSGFTAGERARHWRLVAGGEVDVVVGTRSALFAPLPDPGLIVVDEEHDQSYKQDSVPRYHGRDLAVVYARQLSIPILLGSATPSLETIHNVYRDRYEVLQLKNRPAGGCLPEPVVVDMRRECNEQRMQVALSRTLVEGLEQVRERGEQAIVLLNRRGWSPVLSCFSCGEVAMCPHCDISLTYHRGPGSLLCHYCSHERPMPRRCEHCGQDTLTTSGWGTEQLAAQIADRVPGLSVLRVDADTVGSRQGHALLFQRFARGEADCLVGTQMVAKGLDFPRVTLVGVVAADQGLGIPDFRASERTYQLIAQVAGRAGRGERAGRVVVQAFDTEAPAIRCAIEHRPRRFFDAEMRLREEYGYPPFAGLIRFLWRGPDHAKVVATAQRHGASLLQVAEGLPVLGPNPAGLSFLKGQHRMHALVKAGNRAAAQHFLDRLAAVDALDCPNRVHVAIDVDPYAIT